jgi:hypothetical protein
MSKVEKLIAQQTALADIKKELSKEHKIFMQFRTELDPIMDKLVDKQVEEQERISWCLSVFIVKED